MIEAILNRLRGTGVLKHFGTLRVEEMKIWKLTTPKIEFEIKLVWNHIYGLYFALIFGFLTGSIWIGLLTLVAYLIGESFGWGKWVGALCYPETKTNLEKEYQDKEGYKFPFIHYMANFIIPEKKYFFKYCNLALGIRGFIWALCLYLALFIFDYISYFEYLFIAIIWGIGFPLACYLSRLKSFNYKNKFISIVGKWETQEIYYGFIHFVCNIYIILKVVNGV